MNADASASFGQLRTLVLLHPSASRLRRLNSTIPATAHEIPKKVNTAEGIERPSKKLVEDVLSCPDPINGDKSSAMEMVPFIGAQNFDAVHAPQVFKYFWVLAIACNVVNFLIFKTRSKQYVQQRPELADGYKKYFLGFLLWSSLPWIVMGVGIVFGGVPNVFSYFHPQDPNPFIRAWFGSIILIWLLGFFWLFARRGAEFLVNHPGLFNRNFDTAAKIKGFYCLTLVGGAVGLYFMYNNHIPTFNQ